MKEIPFLSLALDLPPAPLYLDERMQNIIPQVPLAQLLNKFNGETEKVYNISKFILKNSGVQNLQGQFSQTL